MPPYERLDLPGQADLWALRCARPDDYPAMFLNGGGRDTQSGFSLLFAAPQGYRRCEHAAELPAFLNALQPRLTGTDGGGLPFVGGWVVFLAYEAALGLLPHLSASPRGEQPLALALECPDAILVDHARHSTHIISASGRLRRHRQALEATSALPRQGALSWIFQDDPPLRYTAAVERAIGYILAGDIYQANLARRWQGPPATADELRQAFDRLLRLNPAPFSASVDFPDLSLASASPERLLRVDPQGRIETRPIAGTRPRGQDAAQDAAMIRELQQHPKELAEHIMLVDLERHDLGRICQPGSVAVEELLSIESYASVHHLVSNIVGQLRADCTVAEIFAACFPGGTITGCPKIRCMQIIAELEGQARGAYTGSLGYISQHGAMDFNILIRSLELSDGQVHFHAGAGIVADSHADRELRETQAKAAGMLRALQ